MVARPCDNQADLGRVLQVQDLTPNVSSVLPAAEFVGVPLRAEGHSVAGAVQGERVREPGSGRAAGMSALVETGALKEAQLDPVKAKRLRGELLTVREFQSALREKMGWSRSFAEDVATLGYKAVLLREQGPDAVPDQAVAEEIKSLRAASRLILPTL